MTTDNLQTIREAVSGAGDSLLVLVVPAARVRDLFGDSAQARPSYTADLTVPQYREQFEPDLSDSRIRELCAGKAFPDTATEDGRVVPGAYKDSSGGWRITREGIVARQRLEREEGLRRRAEADEEKTARDEAHARARSAGEVNGRGGRMRDKVSRRTTPPAHARKSSPPAERPNRGRWELHAVKGGGT
jgi:hypothetical protein